MRTKLFKVLLFLLASINLIYAINLATILFQQVSDETLFTDFEPGKIIDFSSDSLQSKENDSNLQTKNEAFQT